MPDDPIPTPDPAAAFQRLLDKHSNDGIKLASTLFDENFQLRQKNRELTEKLPKEGSKILSPDESKKWDAYEALGQEPKELKKAVESLPELEKANKELAGMEHIRELADIGLDGSKLKISVLKDQMQKFPDATFSFKTEKDKDGNEAKVAYIKLPDGQETSFNDFAAQNLSDYLPALKVTAEAQTVLPGNGHDPKPQGGAHSIFDRIREKVKTEDTKPKVDINERFGRPAQAA